VIDTDDLGGRRRPVFDRAHLDASAAAHGENLFGGGQRQLVKVGLGQLEVAGIRAAELQARGDHLESRSIQRGRKAEDVAIIPCGRSAGRHGSPFPARLSFLKLGLRALDAHNHAPGCGS
jgi:hypothetical protein